MLVVVKVALPAVFGLSSMRMHASKRISQGRQVETHHLSASVSDGKKSSSFIDIPKHLKEVRLEKSSGYASHSTIQNGMFF